MLQVDAHVGVPEQDVEAVEGMYQKGKYVYKLDGAISDTGERHGGFLQGVASSLLAAQLLMAVWAKAIEEGQGIAT